MRFSNKRSVILTLCLFGSGMQPGCNDSWSGRADPPIAAAPVLKTAKDPLTDAEIAQFFAVVAELPGGKVPEFQPVDGAALGEHLPPDRLIRAFRQEFRDQLDPIEQGRHLARDPVLARILQQHHILPEEFAALVTRIIFAISAAEVLPAPQYLDRLVDKAQQRLDTLVSHGAFADSSTATATSHRGDGERQASIDVIRRTVAFLEYVALSRSVPDASCSVVRRNRSKLQSLLPDLDRAGEQFATWSREFADVVPAGFSN